MAFQLEAREAIVMYRYVMPFPVPPGTSDEAVQGGGVYFRAHPAEYAESRRRAGVTLERAYLQKTPTGSGVVTYVEGERPFAETFGALLDPALELNRWFTDFLVKVHGLDPAQAASAPPPETIGDWSDPAVMERKRGLAFTAPIMPGMDDAGRALATAAFVTRAAELAASRRALHQNREVVTLQATPMGSFVSVYLEGDDPVTGNREFAASQSPYDVWFKTELAKLVPPGIDFNESLPPITEIFDSTQYLGG
ncbi:MAG: hypothetical protein ACRDF7_09525 [Candidatus Limnocylindrales bacterium]